MFKWILAFGGYFFLRFPGAIIGFIIGSVIDSFKNGGINVETVFNDRKEVSPADFELNLLSLCSIVIKADGKVNENELQYVRSYFVTTYGKDKANAVFRTFNEVVKKREISAERICAYLNQRTRYETRVQLIHFLFGIAKADGAVTQSETLKIREIAGYLKVHYRDFESIMAMFIEAADNAYKILEVSPNASDADVKSAYRQMVKKYHPDKVRSNDQAIKKGAEEKFKEVQRAYEQIQKERGI
ncbi:DnaJ-class molecular chaperone with C-terminal Zn finger domain [Galbibacter orientalis DSM 19592]|uniref:DnaJ-class molecular chaperone with C-terminal Zn finger domain n=1 Tax=Galbibacter orientalis DSM 19592 TaxID=926559 RepID=I3C4E1_9FLAO|nr:TerB family tellurite resistance protein [Galbibacter orientalis]EIJ38484.1 DnaJ-class molecular chaperone with C-terminal Zn finger domain [Galbibacter orientalis DSM 19592]